MNELKIKNLLVKGSVFELVWKLKFIIVDIIYNQFTDYVILKAFIGKLIKMNRKVN